MSELDVWMAARKPPPPAGLAPSLRDVNEGTGLDASLSSAGLDRLDAARARPGRMRESAFRLLEADALLTYACEAALEADDPDAALRRILAVLGS